MEKRKPNPRSDASAQSVKRGVRLVTRHAASAKIIRGKKRVSETKADEPTISWQFGVRFAILADGRRIYYPLTAGKLTRTQIRKAVRDAMEDHDNS